MQPPFQQSLRLGRKIGALVRVDECIGSMTASSYPKPMQTLIGGYRYTAVCSPSCNPQCRCAKMVGRSVVGSIACSRWRVAAPIPSMRKSAPKTGRIYWPDILLEQWSDEDKRSPGWVQKPLACDFIAYAYAPSGVCFLLPVVPLQRAWRQHGRKWIGLYGQRRARNPGYMSVSVPVPRAVLVQAIAEAMMV